ncbi:MAG: transketolase [Thermoplasmata archaeon]|nr:transketolase [Thermoplasmata archaeon]
MSAVDDLSVGTLRFLSVDMVEAARSGHPGLPLGAAPMAYVLWDRHLRHNPANPKWPNRDRFLLSAGHGSALLYSLLHTTGYDLALDELRHFRQWGSRTPGHPEAGHTPGVEATTGPLGQGFAMGVGMAIAERFLANTFNREGHDLIDHRTFALVSDGDLMEGIASEAASLAGRIGLGKLTYLYDDNHVSLEGGTELAFTEDVGKRFASYGWRVQHVADGNDLEAIDAALSTAIVSNGQPNLIIVRTHIGYGSPRQDTKDAHGEPLGPDGVRATKEKLGWPLSPTFLVPEAAGQHLGESLGRGAKWEADWNARRDEYARKFPDFGQKLTEALSGTLPTGWAEGLPAYDPKSGDVATRDAGTAMINEISRRIPTFLGGSADLNPSTRTYLTGGGEMGLDGGSGKNVHFGVREHAMMAIVNGMAMHGGVLAFGATFFVFSDYARPAIRLGALMRSKSLYVFTHDSVALGEDGPTHQPVEQLWSLRAIPGLTVLRPADANETVAAWRLALERPGPAAIVLTRQKLPVLDPAAYPVAEGVSQGGYTLSEAGEGPVALIFIATGSEVSLALAAQRTLAERGVRTRVVSMPSVEVFSEQGAQYRERVLPPGVPKLAVEAGSPVGWWRFVGESGGVIGIERFGASAPGPVVLDRLGFNVPHVVETALALLPPEQRGTSSTAR